MADSDETPPMGWDEAVERVRLAKAALLRAKAEAVRPRDPLFGRFLSAQADSLDPPPASEVTGGGSVNVDRAQIARLFSDWYLEPASCPESSRSGRPWLGWVQAFARRMYPVAAGFLGGLAAAALAGGGF